MKSLGVLLVDDEGQIREIVRDYLSLDSTLTIVGEAIDGKSALLQVAALKPDVVLMDMQMPGMSGVEATRHICANHDDVFILGMSTFTTDEYVVDLLRAGASGYLVKSTPPHEILRAVHAVCSGDTVLSPEVTRHVVSALQSSAKAEIMPNEIVMRQLTRKELEVIQLLGQGMSNKEMAAKLFVTESSVKARFVKVMHKLGVRDRVQILVSAMENGLIAFEPRS